MKSSRQHSALNIWHALPHILIWLGLFIMCIFFGYGTVFANLLPALPLIIALIFAWDAPPLSMRLSLLLSGVFYDMLAGLPLGFTGLLWTVIYLLHTRKNFDVDDDEPFITRYMIISMWIFAYVTLEYIASLLLSLHLSTISSMFARALLMIFLTPSIAWFVATSRKSLYRKLWVFLPHEVKPL